MDLPAGFKSSITEAPPLLKHVSVEYNGRMAYTTIGLKDDPDETVSKLVSIMLNIKMGSDLNERPVRKPRKDTGEMTDLERKRARRKARRLARQLRNRNEE